MKCVKKAKADIEGASGTVVYDAFKCEYTFNEVKQQLHILSDNEVIAKQFSHSTNSKESQTKQEFLSLTNFFFILIFFLGINQ